MPLLAIFGICAMLFTAWVVSLFIPFLPLYPIAWTAVGFLLFAELLVLVTLGLVLGKRTLGHTPVTATFLLYPVLYVLFSIAIVPVAFTLHSFTYLFLAHFSGLLVLMGLAFAMIGVARQNREETQVQAEKRADIRSKATKLGLCVSRLGSLDKTYVTPELTLVAERLGYAPESSDSKECAVCDAQIDLLIEKIENCVGTFQNAPDEGKAKLASLVGELSRQLEYRKSTLN